MRLVVKGFEDEFAVPVTFVALETEDGRESDGGQVAEPVAGRPGHCGP